MRYVWNFECDNLRLHANIIVNSLLQSADAISAGAAEPQLQHPLLDDADYMVFRSPFRPLEDDDFESAEAAAVRRTPSLVVRGNWALACVNLARNRITERGLETLLQALKMQSWMRAKMTTSEKEREMTVLPGLMRLILTVRDTILL